jgi:hypothetical protein
VVNLANEKNLLRPSELPEEERKRRASEAGKASGEARRKRRAMKTVLNEILAMPADPNGMPLGVSSVVPGEIDNQTLMLAQLFRKATGYDYDETETQTGDTCVQKLKRKHIPPDVSAVKEIRNILGESRDSAAEKAERKARTEKLKADTEAQRAKSGAQEEIADDGFLEALAGEAEDVWRED